MITVTVHSVMFDTDYEFCLDSNVPASDLADEIGEIICQKEQCMLSGNPDHLVLYSMERQCVIPQNTTLSEFGVRTGDVLYFG